MINLWIMIGINAIGRVMVIDYSACPVLCYLFGMGPEKLIIRVPPHGKVVWLLPQIDHLSGSPKVTVSSFRITGERLRM